MKDIIQYNEMVGREGIALQHGMNHRPNNKNYSIFLMSIREGSPYNDGFDESGKILTYEGHDLTKRESKNPKEEDQPLFTKNGKLTRNGIFFKAAEDFKLSRRKKPEVIRVYEKIKNNVWSDKGLFHLIDATYQSSELENRKVFKFILEPEAAGEKLTDEVEEFEFSRRIPTEVKRIVWERDNGKCVQCQSSENLHFDHIIPWSKGGSSLDPKNIQILCGKHNLQKSDKII